MLFIFAHKFTLHTSERKELGKELRTTIWPSNKNWLKKIKCLMYTETCHTYTVFKVKNFKNVFWFWCGWKFLKNRHCSWYGRHKISWFHLCQAAVGNYQEAEEILLSITSEKLKQGGGQQHVEWLIERLGYFIFYSVMDFRQTFFCNKQMYD